MRTMNRIKHWRVLGSGILPLLMAVVVAIVFVSVPSDARASGRHGSKGGHFKRHQGFRGGSSRGFRGRSGHRSRHRGFHLGFGFNHYGPGSFGSFGSNFYPYSPRFDPPFRPRFIPVPVPSQNPGEISGNDLPAGCQQVREFQTEIVIDGQTVPAFGSACLMADGEWRQLGLRSAPSSAPSTNGGGNAAPNPPANSSPLVPNPSDPDDAEG